jgi:hypothetical protein
MINLSRRIYNGRLFLWLTPLATSANLRSRIFILLIAKNVNALLILIFLPIIFMFYLDLIHNWN